MGAIYSNTDIAVQGTVAIKENTGANLYLDQDASVVVTDVLTGSSISLTAAAPADKKTVAKAGKKTDGTDVTPEEFKFRCAGRGWIKRSAEGKRICYRDTKSHTYSFSVIFNLSEQISEMDGS